MTNKALLIGAVALILLGGVGGWWFRGVVDPRYTFVAADTTGVHISGTTTTGTLDAQVDLKPDTLKPDTVFKTVIRYLRDTSNSGELERLMAPHGADSTFGSDIGLVSDSGDIVSVTVPVSLHVTYDPLAEQFSFRHTLGESTFKLPIRRTHDVRTEYSNYWLWFDFGLGYQLSGSVATDAALGIQDWGFRGVFIQEHKPTFFIEKRFRIL